VTRFCWHPEARLIDGQNRAHGPLAGKGGVLCAKAPALALAGALSGHPFRIGAPEAPCPLSGFETLTSGSTGTPRRIARSFASWTASFAVNARIFGTGPGRAVAVLGPLVQSLSLYGAVEALHLGATLHDLALLRPDRQRRAIAERGIGLIWASPPQLQLLVESKGTPCPSVKTLMIGGASLSPALSTALAQVFPNAAITQFYGAAEASFVTMATAHTPAHSVGQAFPGTEIALGQPPAPQAAGRIWVRSPYLFAQYAGPDQGIAEWQDGWLGLGEVAHWDGPHLVLEGRIDRMVTIAGHNIYPEAVEALILSCPGVKRAAVLPLPDAKRGHVLTVVLQGDATREEALRQSIRAGFGPLATPRRIIWRNGDWPLLPSGKVDLRALEQGLLA
jgi:long-chain acyl-CoA synthetase